MKNKRKICAALMLISFMSHCATAADDEIFTGSCFDEPGCMWTLNKTKGTIVFENALNFCISKIHDSKFDWGLTDFIEEGVIANGTQRISFYPFHNFLNLKKVLL